LSVVKGLTKTAYDFFNAHYRNKIKDSMLSDMNRILSLAYLLYYFCKHKYTERGCP